VLDYVLPWLDLFKIDLKGFDDRRYRQLGGRLQPILDTIAAVHERGVWVEVVTLLVPGFNDSTEELQSLTSFLATVSPDIPWHVTAFHPDYRMTALPGRRPTCCCAPSGLGREGGLRFVYAGNIPGAVGDLENTRCPGCTKTLIRRVGFAVRENHLTAEGACPRATHGCRAAGVATRGLAVDGIIETMAVVDALSRPLSSLRVSVTDRCNLRCEYCMPEKDYLWLPREDLLTFEEIGGSRGLRRPWRQQDPPDGWRAAAAARSAEPREAAGRPARHRRSSADHERRAAPRPGRGPGRRRSPSDHGQPRHAQARALLSS